MENHITFSQAVEGYKLYARAGHLSHYTIKDYMTTYRKFGKYLDDDFPMYHIKPEHIRSFLAEQTVSKKTILNYHIGLSSLWTWAVQEEIVTEQIVRKVRRPKPRREVITYNLAPAIAGAFVLSSCPKYGGFFWRVLRHYDISQDQTVTLPLSWGC
jgi:site-specific recombinase XerD